MKAGEEVELAAALPDPYGHGFVRSENPLQRTVEKWQRQEELRMKVGTFARRRILLLLRLLLGLSVAIVALVSVLFPETAPPNP